MFGAGFGEIMGTMARIGFFDNQVHPILENGKRPTYKNFLIELLKDEGKNLIGTTHVEEDIAKRIFSLGLCKERGTAARTAKTIMLVK